jgi:hypothetical protein
MKLFEKNMRVLKSNNKSLYKKIREYKNSDELLIEDSSEVEKIIKDKKNNIKIYVEKTRTDNYTIRVENNDKDIYFHSKYDPVREAKSKIKNFKPKDKKQVFALGFGLGYHLNELADRNKYDRIIIIEPFMSIFYTALNFVDLRKVLKSQKIIYIIGSMDPLFDVIRKYFSLTLEKELAFLEHDPSHNLFEDKYKDIYQQIRKGINYKQVELVTNIKSARQWRNNIIANLPFIFKSPKADDFFGEFKDIPAICVSAGPSLDKNINDIKNAEGKAIIMCVDSALEPLLKNNIEPDIVVSMDGHLDKFYQFKDINKIIEPILFLELATYYKTPRRWNSKQVYFTMKRNFSFWIEKLNGEYTSIHTGGTVAHSMVDLAYKFGSDPIILVGQDLAYSENKSHASGTYKENREINGEKLIEINDIYGNKVSTSKNFMTMISYFENYFYNKPDRTYIDATEGGAKIKNTEIKTMKEVVKEYCDKDIHLNFKNKLKSKFKKFKPKLSKKEVENSIINLLQELDQAIDLSLQQLSLISTIENNFKNSDKLSKRSINKFRNELKSLESKIENLKNVKHCVNRILIIEAMKYEEVKSKYYISEIKKFAEEIKYYRSYRVQYMEELKKCRNLINDLYLKKDNQEEKNNDNLLK